MAGSNVTIIFVPREVFSTTRTCLERLLECTDGPYELIVVDGNSPAGVQEYLDAAALKHGFTLIRTDEWVTPNQARNIGLRHVYTPYLVFVDNDILLSDGWLEPLLECAKQTGAWAVLPLCFEHLPELSRLHMAGGLAQIGQEKDGSRYYLERHHLAHELLSEVEHPLERHETGLLEFHTVLLSMDLFDRLGPLDEGLMNQAEHADLSLLIKQEGHKIVLEPASRMTYVPPRKLESADRNFFELRWSEAWVEETEKRFVEKWNLSPQHRELDAAVHWVRRHRRHGFRFGQLLGKIVGRRLSDAIQWYLLSGLEARWNRWRFPPQRHGKLPRPSNQIVHRSVDAATRVSG